MTSIVIIDYGSGNLRSVAKAFQRVTPNVVVSADTRTVQTASHIVLPGVGAFADCMAGLCALPDMLDVLSDEVLVQKKWFLGVCVGMQLLFEHGYEHGTNKGLAWLKGNVAPIASPSLKIPHMGWNNLQLKQKSPLLKDIANGDHAYFVHSYHAKLTDNSQLLATTEYGGDITAIVGKDNIFGTQFHPEKSQETGLKIIENFVGL